MLKEIKSEDATSIAGTLSSTLPSFMFSSTTATAIATIASYYFGELATLEYRFVEYDTDTIPFNYVSAMCYKIIMNLLKYKQMFDDATAQLKYTDLDKGKTIKVTDGRTVNSSGSDTVGVITHNGDTYYSATEDAPVNSNLDSLTYPNRKMKNIDTVDGTENSTKNYSNGVIHGGGVDTVSSNPYYYQTYLEVLKNYNLYDVLIKAFNTVVYEFNFCG